MVMRCYHGDGSVTMVMRCYHGDGIVTMVMSVVAMFPRVQKVLRDK